MNRNRKRGISSGRWAILKERFQYLDGEISRAHNVSRVGDVIPAMMKGYGLEDRLWEESLTNEWTSLVGAQVAKHARPGRLQRKVLHVFVSNSVWLNELSRYSQVQMLSNVQSRFGSDRIRSLRLQLDPEAR